MNPSELIKRLLLLSEKAVDESLALEWDDPEDRYIWRELQELRSLAQSALDQPRELTDEEIGQWQSDCADLTRAPEGTGDHYWAFEVEPDYVANIVRAAFSRWGRPAIKPVPVSERLPGPEDCDTERQVWTTEYKCDLVYNPLWRLTELPRQELNEDFSNAYFWRNVTYWAPHWALPTPTINPETP